MTGITIQSYGNESVWVDFGVYVADNSIDGKGASYRISDISILVMEKDESHIIVKMKDFITSNNWTLSWQLDPDKPSYLVVDSVNGVAPTSQMDLLRKLEALRG